MSFLQARSLFHITGSVTVWVTATLLCAVGTTASALTPEKKTTRGGCHYQFFYPDKHAIGWTLKRPLITDDLIDLSVPAAFTGINGGVSGVYAIDGKLLNKGNYDHAISGEVLIENGLCKILRAPGGKVSQATEAEIERKHGALFQVFQIVRDGRGEHFRDKTNFQRRGLAKFSDGTVAVVESDEAITLTQFGTDMQEFGAQDAVNFDMGSWDEGWYRNSEGKAVVLGKDRSNTARQTNWLVFTKSSASNGSSAAGPGGATIQRAARTRTKTLPAIPASTTVKSIQNIVPANWLIEQRIDGNLTGKSSPDVVLQLKEKPASKTADGDQGQQRMLVVLRPEADGAYKVIGCASKLLMCNNWVGVPADTDSANVTVSISAKMLVVNQTAGDAEGFDTTQKFKWDEALDSFVMVDEIVDHYNRTSSESEVTRSDYKSGTRTVTNYQLIESSGRKKRLNGTSSKFKPAIQRFEQAGGSL